MASKEPIVDFDLFDVQRVIAGREKVEANIPQRYEMAQLDGILYEDWPGKRCVGFKDVTEKEFWVRGHMPGRPLMPGVVICECAAQLCAYFVAQCHDFEGLVGLGGLQDIRFRAPVTPNNRLIVMISERRYRPNQLIICQFQAYVDQQRVAEGEIIGSALPEFSASQ